MKRRKKKDTWGDAAGNAPWATHIAPAPGELRIVQALVNTVDLVTGTDELKNLRGVRDWLGRWRFTGAAQEVDKAKRLRFVEVRDALRMLVGANRGGAVDDAAMVKLDDVARNAALRLRFDARGASRFEPATDGFEGVLSALFLIVGMARVKGQWPRLKLCANPECRRAFYDASPNRSGKWCTMRLCGNKLKSRTFRRRNPGYLWY